VPVSKYLVCSLAKKGLASGEELSLGEVSIVEALVANGENMGAAGVPIKTLDGIDR